MFDARGMFGVAPPAARVGRAVSAAWAPPASDYARVWRSQSAKAAHSQRSSVPVRQHR
jgi:hypothetical protein